MATAPIEPTTAEESTTKPAAPESKSQQATRIFNECYSMTPVPPRKDIIARVMHETGLTQAGAATYLQNYKAKNNLTVPK